MTRINPDKLMLSKWTAQHPSNKEKHFIVTKLFRDENGSVLEIEIQAVMTRSTEHMDWQTLQITEHWRIGWK